METKIIDNYEDFLKLKPLWDNLLEESDNDLVYLTFEWLQTWWEYFGYGHKLFVVLIEESKKIIAAAPLMIENRRIGNLVTLRKLKFIAYEISDYMDFIAIRNKKESFDLIFKSVIDNSHLWDAAELFYIPENSPNLTFWKDSISTLRTFKKIFSKQDVAVSIDMYRNANNYSELEKVIPSKERIGRVLRKKRSKLLRDKQDVVLNRENISSRIEEDFTHFVDFHKDRWRAKSNGSQFENPAVQKYYLNVAKKLSERGWFELASIKSKDDYIAMVYGYIYKGRYYHYISVLNPDYSRYSPSQLLVRFLLESFYAEGNIKVFDFLRGGELDKYDWSKDELKLYSATIYPAKFKSFMIYASKKMNDSLFMRLRRIKFLKYLKRILLDRHKHS